MRIIMRMCLQVSRASVSFFLILFELFISGFNIDAYKQSVDQRK